MSEIINAQISVVRKEIKDITGRDISDDRAFSHVLLKYFFDVDTKDQIDFDQVTDGQNDGGVDFLYYDEENAKLLLCQSKYRETLSPDEVTYEIGKMYNTWQNFKRANTANYNERLKKTLQNALDQLPEENSDNVEFHLFTIASVDVNRAMQKISNTQLAFSAEAVLIHTEDTIEKQIQRSLESIPIVLEDKIKLDAANNYLEYDSDDFTGIMCNVSSASLIWLYNKYAGAGLFDLNIRKYIRNTMVDTGIKKTLDGDRPNFWFLNNGIIIACQEFWLDGDTVKLQNFSIVNGGQTTTLIASYKGSNKQEFFIPCKIVASKNDKDRSIFFTRIAEATNSQKPIYARDLKSNSPEMVRLSKWLAQEGVYLEIKRGHKPKQKTKYKIKNDELGQLILSFALQKPGISRNGKRVIFQNQNIYDKIFRVNYENDSNKKNFILDLIDLNDRYVEIEHSLISGPLTSIEKDVLHNGKQAIFALMGVCYRLENRDLSVQDLLWQPEESLPHSPFIYGKIHSAYKDDDLESKLKNIVLCIVRILAEAYEKSYNNRTTTSVSNFTKTDPKYYSVLVPALIHAFDYQEGRELRQCMIVFKR